MEKVFKHRKSGELAYYKEGIFKQNNCSVEIGVEPSSEFWNEILFITEDGVEMFEGGVYYVPQRKDKKYDGFLSIIAVSGMVYKSETKRFASKQKALEFIEYFNKEAVFTTFDNVEIYKNQSYWGLHTKTWLLEYVDDGIDYDLKEDDLPDNTYLTFAEKENLEEYILMNKPILSLNDLLSVWGSDVDIERYKESPLFKNFKDLASGKI